MVRFARDHDLIISVIFDWNDSKVHPAAGSDDERRYFRYGVNRLSAYSNVTCFFDEPFCQRAEVAPAKLQKGGRRLLIE